MHDTCLHDGVGEHAGDGVGQAGKRIRGLTVVCPAGDYVEDTCRWAGFSWWHAVSAVTC